MCSSFFAVNNRFSRFRVFFVLLILLLLAPASEAAIRYVNTGAGGANNGTSWANAFTDLQDALAISVSGDEIWVAAGIYRPTTGIDRSISFVLKNGVAIYGGFAGTETSRAQRKWAINETVLSGNIGAPGANTDNSFHVVVSSGVNSTAVLDGFIITGGYANGTTDERRRGGGLYNDGGSPTVINCRFISNHADMDGGGIFNHNGSPVVTDCAFTGNSAGEHGGGMYNWWHASNPVITNCTFTSNVAYRGGAVCNYLSGTPKFTECVFTNNFASGHGGGMHNEDGNPEVVRALFSGNRAALDGGALYNNGSSQKTIKESTFSRNSSGGSGGAMYNRYAYSALSITGATFFGNVAMAGGGAIYNHISGPVLVNCTFSANRATSGAGLFNTNSSNPTMMNCTFAENRADFGGDALYNRQSSNPVATNSIFWGRGSPFGQIQNETGVTATVTYSVTDQPGTGNTAADPKLGPLADNGGPTRTHALYDGSAALNSGTSTGAPITDQRGAPRPQGGGVDIGAYERGGGIPVPGPSAGGGGGCDLGFSPSLVLLLLPLLFLKKR